MDLTSCPLVISKGQVHVLIIGVLYYKGLFPNCSQILPSAFAKASASGERK